MRKLGISIDQMSPQMKLVGLVNKIILFHLAPNRMLCTKYFSRYDFLKIYLQKLQIEFFFIFYDFK